MVEVVVVGGGITGLFCAYYLAREGVRVTLVEKGELGSGSVHAAGLIEPATFYQINTWRYLRDALRFAQRGVLRLRRVEPRWLLSYLAHFGERLGQEDLELVRRMGRFSLSEYRRLGEEDEGWGYSEPGLLELYEEKQSLEAALGSLDQRGGWRRVDWEGYAGGIVFDEVGLVTTERFVEKMGSELAELGVSVVRAPARHVWLDGRVEVGQKVFSPAKTVVAAGVECRRLGVPVTGVGGAGYRFRPRTPKALERPIIVYERSAAIVWAGEWVKATVGLDFSLKPAAPGAHVVAQLVARFVGPSDPLDVRAGLRPASPDGLPIVGAKHNLVVATGGFRLGWTFAPAIAREAADIVLGKTGGNPRLARYAAALRSGSLS